MTQVLEQKTEAKDFLLDMMEKYAMGDKSLDTLPTLSGETKEGLYQYAYRFYENGKYQDAINFFRFLTLVGTQVKKHWVGLGAAQQMNKQYQDAIHSYSIAAILDVKDPYIHVYAADCFFAVEDISHGIDALNAAQKIVEKSKKYKKLLPELTILREAWEKRLTRNKTHGN